MCDLPNVKNQSQSYPSTTLPHHPSRKRTSIRNNRTGLHHKATTIRRIRYNPHHHGHGLLEGVHLPSLFRNHRLRRGRHPLRQSRCPTLRRSQQNHLRPRCPLYVQIHHRTLPTSRYPSEYQYGVSPSDRWGKRANKSNARTIPPNLLWNATRQLARMAPSSAIHKELVALRNHEENAIRLAHRVHPTHPPTEPKNKRPLS